MYFDLCVDEEHYIIFRTGGGLRGLGYGLAFELRTRNLFKPIRNNMVELEQLLYI